MKCIAIDDLPFVDTPDEIEIAETSEPVVEAEAVIEAEPVVESVPEVAEEPVEEVVAEPAEEEESVTEDLPVLGAMGVAAAAAATTATAAAHVVEDLPAAEPIVETVAEPVAEPVVEPVVEPIAEVVVEPVVEIVVEPDPASAAPAGEPEDDDMPLFAEPQPLFEAALNSPKAKKAVIDVMTDKQAWRTDMAGSPVRDLLSAISLNDRVHFIKTLFRDDAVLFQQTRAKINAMSSLDEVVDYVTANFDWDMSSQSVYRFMMAVRRKVQA